MADFNDSLQNAAAKPSREAPLSAIEARLRRRHRLRQGAVGVCAIALVGALGGGIALSTDDGPSIKTGLPPAAAQVTGGDPAISVELPDGWVESPIEPPFRFDYEILAVGTVLQPTGAAHHVCQEAPEFHDDVFVQLQEFTHVIVASEAIDAPVLAYGERDEFVPRPSDFSAATPNQRLSCLTNDPTMNWRGIGFSFEDQGRLFNATIGFGPASTPERAAEAFAILNSLVVTPLTDIPISEPTIPTVPPSTVPPSAETEAITAAFLGWIDTRPIDASGVYIEDFASIRDAVIGAAEANGHPDEYRGRVEAITRVGETDADVIYSFIIDGQPVVANLRGHAVKIDGVWLVSRDTVCEALLQGPVHCPPRE